MSDHNWANRTMWTGDNLDVMRGMNSESVDLIYLDPPFNSNKTYSAPIGSKAAGAKFEGHVDAGRRRPRVAWRNRRAEPSRLRGHRRSWRDPRVRDEVLPDHDGRAAPGTAPAVETTRIALSPLRPDGEPLLEVAPGCGVLANLFRQRDCLVLQRRREKQETLGQETRHALVLRQE